MCDQVSQPSTCISICSLRLTPTSGPACIAAMTEHMILHHIKHPAIVDCRFYKKQGSAHFVGMELLKGGSLADLVLKKGNLHEVCGEVLIRHHYLWATHSMHILCLLFY